MPSPRQRESLTGGLGSALEAVARALSALPVPGMLIGGMAVIIHGVPRIDDAAAFAEANQVLLLRHAPSGVDVDVSLAWLPFESEAIAAAEDVDIGGVDIRVARPEDLLIYKAVAFRPQDQQDIERLLALHGRQMDLDRVRRVVGEFAAALEDPARLEALEAIVRRVGPA